MSTLTKENIQFIDNYLDNSGIVYSDIRLEMVDHIAAGIEEQMNTGDRRGFYAVFKDYMVENKASILKNNQAFIKATDRRIIRTLIKQLLSVKGGLLFATIGLALYTGLKNLDLQYFNSLVSNVEISLQFGALFITLLISRGGKVRYSALERLLFVWGLSFSFVFIIFNSKYNNSFSEGYTYVYLIGKSVFLMFPILFLMTVIKFKKDSELKFKNIL